MRAAPTLEALEARILYSADAPPVVLTHELATALIQTPAPEAGAATQRQVSAANAGAHE